MNFFRHMDLYKAIIVISLILLPVALGMVYWVDGEIETARLRIQAAEKPGGELERIGMLQRQLQTVEQNAAAVRTSGGSPAVFFQNQITASSGGTISSNEYEISPEKSVRVTGRGNSRGSARDQIVSVSFRKGRDLPRKLVHALVFNCESTGAQIWKLRRLSMKNTEVASISRNQTPPKTVKDDWTILNLDFARREPDTTTRR